MNQFRNKEGFISVTGGRVWYRIAGDGPGIPLLVLHGGPGGASMESDPLSRLGEERPVIYYDQLGAGKSDSPQDPSLWTVERFIEELEQVRDYLGLEEVQILGHSWGTMLLAAYLLRKPEGVKSAIFSSPALSARRWEKDQRNYLKAFPKETQEIIETCERNQTTDSEDYQKAMIDYYERHVCRKLPWPEDLMEAVEQMNEEIYGMMWGPSEFTVTGTLRDFDVTDRLHEIDMPTLFMCGRYDEATPDTTHFYASLIPGAKYEVLENSAHFTFIEEPEAYIRIVREFLE